MEVQMEVEKQGEDWRGGAEAVQSLSPGSSIPICYHSRFGPHDDLLLLEIDDKLLTDVLGNRCCPSAVCSHPRKEACNDCLHGGNRIHLFLKTPKGFYLFECVCLRSGGFGNDDALILQKCQDLVITLQADFFSLDSGETVVSFCWTLTPKTLVRKFID